MLNAQNYQNIKAALSSLSKNSVEKRSVILQATASAAGYESFEQSQALNDRELKIKHHVWAEFSPQSGNLIVSAADLQLEVSILRQFGRKVALVKQKSRSDCEKILFDNMFELTNDGFNQITESNVTVQHDAVEITVGLDTLRIKRDCNYNEVDVYIVKDGEVSGEAKSFMFNQAWVDQNYDVWLNPNVQMKRIIWEADAMVGTSKDELHKCIEEPILKELQRRDLSIWDAIQTGIYLESEDRGYPDEVMPEKPNKLLLKSLGAVAYPLLKTAMAKELDNLKDSMSCTDDDLCELLMMTKHQYEWFLATN
ncbi:hypothetical protein [Vibrio crassostreae]|uniref:hypothetical protein n=1 Tax=Vibrio crassostreae TaxID=246167 RepID=UPI001B312718|nr:hypothetical protein [Vibrio crassostreae]